MSTPQEACLSTMVTLRPLLNWGSLIPGTTVSVLLALGGRSTPASCSSLARRRYDQLLWHARGRGYRWNGQPRLSNRHVRAYTGDEHGPTTCPEWLRSKQARGSPRGSAVMCPPPLARHMKISWRRTPLRECECGVLLRHLSGIALLWPSLPVCLRSCPFISWDLPFTHP